MILSKLERLLQFLCLSWTNAENPNQEPQYHHPDCRWERLAVFTRPSGRVFFDDCWTAGYHWVIPLKTRTFVHRKWDNTWWVTRTAWSAWAPRQASKHGSCWVLHLFGWSCFICFALLPDAKKHPNRCLRNNLEQHIITPNTGSVVQNHFHVISFKLLFCW